MGSNKYFDDEEELYTPVPKNWNLMSPFEQPAPSTWSIGDMTPMDFTTPLQPRIDRLNSEADSLRGDYTDKLALANSVAELSPAQKVLSGILPLATMFIGRAIAGNSGGAFGATSGLQAGQNFEKQELATQQNKSVQAQKEAQRLYDEIKRKEDQSFQLERTEALSGLTRDRQMDLAKFRHDNPINAGASAYSADEANVLAKLDRGEDLTADEARIAYTNPKIAQLVQRKLEDQSRDDRTQKKREFEMGKGNIPGLKLIDGTTADSHSTKMAQETYASYQNAMGATDRALSVFSDPDASIQDMDTELSSMIIEIKLMKKMGANFTEMEKGLISSGLPGIAGASVSQMSDYLKKEMQGQDPMALLNRMKNVLSFEAKNTLKTYKYTLDDTGGSGGEPDQMTEADLRRLGADDAKIAKLRAAGRVKD